MRQKPSYNLANLTGNIKIDCKISETMLNLVKLSEMEEIQSL
jgi:hypothetical protein